MQDTDALHIRYEGSLSMRKMHNPVVGTDHPCTMDRLTESTEVIRRMISVLDVVERYGPIGMRRISRILDEPEHLVRYSLSLLEDSAVIKSTMKGAEVCCDVTLYRDGLKEELRKFIMELQNVVDGL